MLGQEPASLFLAPSPYCITPIPTFPRRGGRRKELAAEVLLPRHKPFASEPYFFPLPGREGAQGEGDQNKEGRSAAAYIPWPRAPDPWPLFHAITRAAFFFTNALSR